MDFRVRGRASPGMTDIREIAPEIPALDFTAILFKQFNETARRANHF
jgi:hypothetical protein